MKINNKIIRLFIQSIKIINHNKREKNERMNE